MKYLIYQLFLFYFLLVNSFNLCVVGGSSGLGKELIYQGLNKKYKILALTNNPSKINLPYRGGGLKEKDTKNSSNKNLLLNKNLEIDNYNNFNKYFYENIVFTLGSGPFEKDYSDIITKDILKEKNQYLKKIILISAEGVGNSLENSNLGIKVMNNWYLQDVYRAKNKQEKIVEEYKNKYNIELEIIRPKALSYGQNIFSIKSRENLAKEILENI